MEDLELVLGNLKDVAKELKEHVYSLLITVLCGEEIPHVQDQERQLCFSPSAFNLSQHQGLFQWVSCSHQVARVLEFSFSISPSNEYSGLISFKIDFKILISNPEIRFYLIQVGC